MFLNEKLKALLICFVASACWACDDEMGAKYDSLLPNRSLVSVPYSLSDSGEIPMELSYSSDEDDVILPPTPQYEIYDTFKMGQEIYHQGVKNVGMVRNVVESLVLEGVYLPKAFCVVHDIDGTETAQPDPSKLDNITAVTPRGSIQEDIAWYKQQGCKFVHSSAWNHFDETVARLVKINMLVKGEFPTQFVCFNIGTYLLKGYVQGHAASMTKNYGVGYYRAKAVSPLAVYPATFQEIEILILVEDSSGNIQTFLKNLSMFNPYPNLKKVMVFWLDEPANEQPK